MVHMEMIVDQQYPGLNPVQFGYEVNDPSHGFGPTVREYWLLHYVVSGFGVYELNFSSLLLSGPIIRQMTKSLGITYG